MVKGQLVSVIVPCYNVAKYVELCVQSIEHQEYSNIEIILVDDGSTDGTGQICDKLAGKDGRIRVVHKENAGVSAARNTGIDISTGEYICFVDGDDFVEKDYIKYLLDLLLASDAQIAVTTQMFTSLNRIQTRKDKSYVLSGEQAAKEMLCYNYPIGVYCKMFRRELLGTCIRFFENVYIGEGFNFNTLALSSAKSVVVGHRKIYTYRLTNENSAMTLFKIEKCEMALRAIEVMRDSLLIKTEEMYNACDYANWLTHASMYVWMVNTNAQNQYPEMFSRCYNFIRGQYRWSFLFVHTRRAEKIKSILLFIHPRLLTTVITFRKTVLSYTKGIRKSILK